MSTWTTEECAAAWGVQPQTFLGYVSRGQAPAPLADPGPDGRRRWDADAVRGFPRPGAGRSRAGATAEAAAPVVAPARLRPAPGRGNPRTVSASQRRRPSGPGSAREAGA